jgi:group II intron reverse transcriptase/maturase
VEVIGSNPIAPTILSSTCRHFRFGCGAIWGHFSNLLDDASLRFALRRGHSLNVRVHGDTDVCMAHQCLHRRHIFTVRFEQRTELVSERMPADPFGNSGSLRCRTDVIQLKRHAAAGVDGETWRHYGEALEQNLQDLSHRLKRGAYRAKPVRRVYIPKTDGRQRPLGVTALEDKLVQRATVEVLNAIYETDFIGFSYGFRPGRNQHKALDALFCGLQERSVNWVLDLDVRSFFDRLSHTWLVRCLQHRIADRRVVRLIQKWLNAGVLEKGTRTFVDAGSPQGGSASPLLANIYLHYVFDLWVQAWRRKRAHGDVIVVRYADDIVVGFEFKGEAERFWAELNERMQKFQLELHPDKTRLFEFGRHAAANRKRSDWASRRPLIFSASSTSAGRRKRDGYWCFGRRFANACRPSCSR